MSHRIAAFFAVAALACAACEPVETPYLGEWALTGGSAVVTCDGFAPRRVDLGTLHASLTVSVLGEFGVFGRWEPTLTEDTCTTAYALDADARELTRDEGSCASLASSRFHVSDDYTAANHIARHVGEVEGIACVIDSTERYRHVCGYADGIEACR